MPKMKSNRGAVKRFKPTATGYKHRKANRSHILTKKSTKRKRHLRHGELLCDSDAKSVQRMIRGG